MTERFIANCGERAMSKRVHVNVHVADETDGRRNGTVGARLTMFQTECPDVISGGQ